MASFVRFIFNLEEIFVESLEATWKAVHYSKNGESILLTWLILCFTILLRSCHK